jgi:hypothetical protein
MRREFPAFSLAYVSQDLYYESRIVLKYLPQAKEVRLVIVPISENRNEEEAGCGM